MKKKTGIWLLLFCIAAVTAAGGWRIWKTPVPVRCYMLDQCGGCSVTNRPCNVCKEEQRYRTELGTLLDEEGLRNKVDFQVYNILYSFYKEELLKTMNVPEEPTDMIYPVAFVGDTMLLGTDEINSKMADTVRKEAAFLKKLSGVFDNPENVEIGCKMIPRMVFFTMEGCSDCEEAKDWLDRKDEELSGQIYENMSFYPVGNGEEGGWEMLKKVYILYGRGQESLWVPTILAGDRCLIGMDEITDYFEKYQPGDKIQTRVPEDYE